MVVEMQAMVNWNWALDGWIVAAGVLCAVAAALLGNFLVLRRMSMLGQIDVKHRFVDCET